MKGFLFLAILVSFLPQSVLADSWKENFLGKLISYFDTNPKAEQYEPVLREKVMSLETSQKLNMEIPFNEKSKTGWQEARHEFLKDKFFDFKIRTFAPLLDSKERGRTFYRHLDNVFYLYALPELEKRGIDGDEEAEIPLDLKIEAFNRHVMPRLHDQASTELVVQLFYKFILSNSETLGKAAWLNPVVKAIVRETKTGPESQTYNRIISLLKEDELRKHGSDLTDFLKVIKDIDAFKELEILLDIDAYSDFRKVRGAFQAIWMKQVAKPKYHEEDFTKDFMILLFLMEDVRTTYEHQAKEKRPFWTNDFFNSKQENIESSLNQLMTNFWVQENTFEEEDELYFHFLAAIACSKGLSQTIRQVAREKLFNSILTSKTDSVNEERLKSSPVFELAFNDLIETYRKKPEVCGILLGNTNNFSELAAAYIGRRLLN